MMGPEQKRLMDRLFNDPNRTLRNFNVFRGDGPATAEQICEQVNRALDEIERRRALGLPDDGPPRTGRKPQRLDEFVASLRSNDDRKPEDLAPCSVETSTPDMEASRG